MLKIDKINFYLRFFILNEKIKNIITFIYLIID